MNPSFLATASAIALAGILGLRWILPPLRVVGQSNAPTLSEGDVIVALRIGRTFRRGDFIVFRRKRHRMVKRLVGLPGEFVEIRGLDILIDGQPLSEPYREPNAANEMERINANVRSVRLPKQQYFVLGDNRTLSTDSRSLGPILDNEIEGRIVLRIWPTPIVFGPSYSIHQTPGLE